MIATAIAWATAFEPGSAAFAQAVEPSPEAQEEAAIAAGATLGEVYTWRDGDRILRVRLQSDLAVRKDGMLAPTGKRLLKAAGGTIVRVGNASATAGPPVFRSQSSGALMTLPGGVLLVLDPAWGEAETQTFFSANGISEDRVSALQGLQNGFLVETEPGFPSLELANSLAARDGVELSSPNWWREMVER